MTTTNMINSSRSYAALRAQRSRLASQVETMQNKVAKAAALQALEMYDAELAGAPVKAVHEPANRKSAAYRAHRTMLLAKLPGTRGKARQVIKTKIAHYDELLAA